MEQNIKNSTGFTPLFDGILIALDSVEAKTESGIIYKSAKQKEMEESGQTRGMVVDIGDQCFSGFEEGDLRPELGDRVILVKYAGQLILGENGKEYRLIRDDEIRMVEQK